MMDATGWWLLGSVIVAGLWSGLLAMVTMVLHPMFQRQDGPTFARQISMFLSTARTAPINYVCVIGLVASPAIALVVMGGPQAPGFALTVAGLVATVSGPFLISRFLAEPNYGVMLSWDPEELPSGWQAARDRYLTLNWARGALTWFAFGCFLAALVVHL